MNVTHIAGPSGDGDPVSPLRRSKNLILGFRIGPKVSGHAVGPRRSLQAAACRSFAIGAACIGILLVDAEAVITFSNPVRSVSASNNKGSSQVIETQGYEPFNQSARVDWEEYWSYPNSYFGPYPNATGQYFSEATQQSIIGLTGITARGSVVGTGSFSFYGEKPLLQNSHSSFKIDILLDAPGTVYLGGLIKYDYDPWGTNNDFPEILITLGEKGEFYSKVIPAGAYGATYEYEIDENFFLPAGQYSFEIFTKTSGRYDAYEIAYDETGTWIEAGSGGGGTATYEITLVPEPSSMLLGTLGIMLLLTRRANGAAMGSAAMGSVPNNRH